METETGKNTAGNQEPEEEKLLPPGRPGNTGTEDAQASPILVLPPEDLLHRGNAVAAAREEQTKPKEEDTRGKLLDRNLREGGLKEALPRSATAPSKIEAPDKQDEESVQRIRTYAADMSEVLQKRGATLSSIITAEKIQSSAPERTPTRPHRSRRGLALAAAAFVLVAVGGGALGAMLYFGQTRTATAVPQTPTLIPVNERSVIFEDGKTPLADLLANAKATAQVGLGDMEALDIATGTRRVSAPDIMTALGAPNELARNSTDVTVGLHAFTHTEPFIIVSVSAYDRAFEAMLSWERTIGDDLGMFFAPPGTPAGVSVHPPALSFVDRVAANVDVRESQSGWPILYAFPRQNLLVITTNESTLREVLARLSLQNSSSSE